MARKAVAKSLKFGKDKKIKDSKDKEVLQLKQESEGSIDFKVNFKGPFCYLWVVNSEGHYTLAYYGTSDLSQEIASVSLPVGDYLLDCNSALDTLDVEIVQ